MPRSKKVPQRSLEEDEPLEEMQVNSRPRLYSSPAPPGTGQAGSGGVGSGSGKGGKGKGGKGKAARARARSRDEPEAAGHLSGFRSSSPCPAPQASPGAVCVGLRLRGD